MIEYLALAAEVTAVLLVISIAYPGKRTGKHGEANSAAINRGDALEPYQDSLQTLRLIAFDTAAKQIGNHSSISDWNVSDIRRQIATSLSDLMPLVIEPNQDVTTRLPLVDSMHRFLAATRSLQTQLGLSIQMSMIAVDSWSELVSKHGSVVADRLLREVASQLSNDLHVHGLVVRFSEHTFAVVLFGVSSRNAFELLEDKRLAISNQPIVLGENEIATSVSIVTTEVNTDDFDHDCRLVDGVWERLEELLAASITSGGNQTRSETVPALEGPPSSDEVVIDSLAKSEPTEIKPEAVKPEAVATSSSAVPVSGEAVTSSDDIAALFAAQKSKPKATPTAASPDTQTAAPVSASNEKASDDDIAALFAAKKSKPKAAPSEASPDTQTAAPVSASNEKASDDDIAAMFAAMKAKPKPPATSPIEEPTTPQAVNPQSASKPTEAITNQKAPESLASSVSADDITALFAAQKSKPKATTTAASTDTPNAPPEPEMPIPEMAEVVEQMVTPVNEPPPKEDEAIEDEAIEDSLVASIDDINSLFEAAKKSHGKKKTEAKV